ISIPTSPTTIAAGASTILDVSWTPDHPGNKNDITAEVFCTNDQDQTNNKGLLAEFVVAPASGGGGGGGGHGGIRGGGIVLDPSVLHGMKGSLATSTAPGFVQ